ncbi:MAG: sugar transferase [Mariniphaga sp.]
MKVKVNSFTDKLIRQSCSRIVVQSTKKISHRKVVRSCSQMVKISTNLLQNISYKNMYKLLKRLFDILVSLIGILILLPFFIPLAIALRLTGEGYIFYFQSRMGYKNTKFQIWKFATMLKASPGLGTGSITLQNDWRLTPMGKFLRKTKINELPQIVNIFKGDMSIVGPRPLMEVDFKKYPANIQPVIYNSPPGLTGIASIVFRDEEKYYSNTEMDPHEFDRKHIAPYKGELELWYQKNLSAYTDLMLVFLTAWAIVAPKSELVYRVFRDLPERPEELSK